MRTLEVTIDVREFEELQVDLADLNAKMQKMVFDTGEEFKALWIQNAEQSLHRPQSYVEAILEGTEYPGEGDLNTYILKPAFKKVRGDKDIGILIEYGFEPFDMKDGLLKGRESRVIAFESFKEGTGKQPTLPQKIYEEFMAEKQDVKTGIAIGGKNHSLLGYSVFEKGVNINPKSVKHNYLLSKPKTWNERQMTPYAWKSHKFQGLKQENSTSFKTFRTVSRKQGNAWIHPGAMPKNIFKTTFDIMKPRFYQRAQEVLESAIK